MNPLGSRRNPATCRTNQGSRQGGSAFTLRAGGVKGMEGGDLLSPLEAVGTSTLKPSTRTQLHASASQHSRHLPQNEPLNPHPLPTQTSTHSVLSQDPPMEGISPSALSQRGAHLSLAEHRSDAGASRNVCIRYEPLFHSCRYRQRAGPPSTAGIDSISG